MFSQTLPCQQFVKQIVPPQIHAIGVESLGVLGAQATT